MGETNSSPSGMSARNTFSILERIDVGETYSNCEIPHRMRTTFSILERIDVGETDNHAVRAITNRALSVSSNGSTWVKPQARAEAAEAHALSVSSNGSTWVKPQVKKDYAASIGTFSILERIDVGET